MMVIFLRDHPPHHYADIRTDIEEKDGGESIGSGGDFVILT
jgi:hypothetical protein